MHRNVLPAFEPRLQNSFFVWNRGAGSSSRPQATAPRSTREPCTDWNAADLYAEGTNLDFAGTLNAGRGSIHGCIRRKFEYFFSFPAPGPVKSNNVARSNV